MKNTGFYPAEILLPKTAEMEKWAVIACDQFTSEKDYWDELAKFVGDARSTLKLTLPEIYLNDNAEERIRVINKNIDEYLAWEKIYAVGGSSFVKESIEKWKK